MSDMLLGVGLLHGSRIWSYAQMLLDCEIFDIVRKMMEGIPVNDETLGMDAIRKVGPGGHYLAQKHTRQHMRELWLTRYLDRRPYDTWAEKLDGPADWAANKAREILSSHQPEPLADGLGEELDHIIASLEKDLS
jgi:trimethylamine--corrinoid protein Co-methyltransferase